MAVTARRCFSVFLDDPAAAGIAVCGCMLSYVSLLRVICNKKTPSMSQKDTEDESDPWYHLSLPLARPHRIQSYPQRDIGRTRRRLPLIESFGARLRTVIGTLYLRGLAPPAAL